MEGTLELKQIAETTFVLLQADWSVVKGRELVEALKPTHVILHASSPQESFYLYTTEETLTRMQGVADAASISVAFNLYETDSTPLLEPHSNAEDAPDRCIIHDGEKLIGFFDATLPPVISSRGTRRGEQV